MTTHLAMAGAMKVGGWYSAEAYRFHGNAARYWAYGNAQHIFLSRDKDRRNRAGTRISGKSTDSTVTRYRK